MRKPLISGLKLLREFRNSAKSLRNTSFTNLASDPASGLQGQVAHRVLSLRS